MLTVICVPLTLAGANRFIVEHHRHHGEFPPGLDFFRIGCVSGGVLRGVAIVSRPTNRNSDNGVTCEVSRCATDGTRNACSFLYGRSARVAREMGFSRIITYTLDSESGASLRASGWKEEKTGIVSFWKSNESKGRTVKERAHYASTKTRWALEIKGGLFK